ncbi:unnamed protein product [Polarella glacialis]|uniref:RRM domain-containing protein n=1 Tax=Polarella glacialis TaxID=89957 RepID=A0A813EUL6_POLGL|nr:unnamed protein product [Polarella glacialis]CAE8639243.1 unnamed protein product [Polarella glacialis]CAE8644586.1 unnamed protein product [Polarella glacialis]CAE8733184.1 unnamed protein product [Polarella glacialis]|mmetsp:Transcript_99229/g.179214  ORF Transcript_99229/g.179214 Transcript_99229/m.179214 type:complete len:120 (+) Transcript_99229:106-465(+)
MATESLDSDDDKEQEAVRPTAVEGEEDTMDDEEEAGVQAGFIVHVRNVSPANSMADVVALFHALGPVFCYRVSDSVVAAELDSAAALEAALALTGTVLAPPKVGHVKIPGERIEVVIPQ